MNDDLISRNALLEMLPKDDVILSFDVRKVVCEAPAVDAEVVRHGRWDSFGVRRTDAKGRNRIEYMFNACTLCENPAVKRTVYCPNRGAKMDGDADAAD